MEPTPAPSPEPDAVVPLPDPVVPDPNASYERAATAPEADAAELAVLAEQIGRPSRGRSAVVHRCGYGLPTVVRVDPRLDDGTPFPTTFWLSCPALNSAVGRLEGDHEMVAVNERLAADEDLRQQYLDAQLRLVAFRDALGGGEKLPGDPTAGGRPGHVKCLHVAVGHHLATGDNVVGAEALDQARPVDCAGPCAGPDKVGEGRTRPGRNRR